MTQEEFEHEILNSEAKSLYTKYCLGQDIWYFSEFLKSQNPSKDYDEFKSFVADRLNVQFNDIAIVGSAKTGFTLSPGKDVYRRFNKEDPNKSDIDVVIVSTELYERFWDAYLEALYNNIPFDYMGFAKSIFRGFIQMKNPAPVNQTIRDWVILVDEFKKDLQVLFDIQHTVNYRIYRSWRYVERYHTSGVAQLKSKIDKSNLKKN